MVLGSKMPRLGRARRKTLPSRCGHSVGLVERLLLSRRLLLCSESNAYAIGLLQRKMFYGLHRKLFQEQRLTEQNLFMSIAWIGADALGMPERCAHASA